MQFFPPVLWAFGISDDTVLNFGEFHHVPILAVMLVVVWAAVALLFEAGAVAFGAGAAVPLLHQARVVVVVVVVVLTAAAPKFIVLFEEAKFCPWLESLSFNRSHSAIDLSNSWR